MSDQTWEYTDEIALLTKRVEALERQLDALTEAHAKFMASVVQMAEYQGVKHLLAPQ